MKILQTDTFTVFSYELKNNLFGGMRLCCVFIAAWAFLQLQSGGYSPVVVCGFSLQWLLLMQSWASIVVACGLSTYSSSSSRAQAQ